MRMFIVIFVLVFSCPSVQAMDKSTPEQSRWWNAHVVSFLYAYYEFDFDKSWKLGKVAFKFPPYEYETKQEFIDYENARRFGFDDGVKIVYRKAINVSLLRVDTIENREWFYTAILFQAKYSPIEYVDVSFYGSEEGAICNRMEWVLFRKGESGFDMITTTESLSMGCKNIEESR